MAEESAYFDTSVVVKRYVEEVRSAQARGFMRRYRLLSSVITPVETVSAVCRRHRAGELSLTDFDAILARLRTDRAHWELVELSLPIRQRAEQLLQQTALRALDALHIASALIVQEDSGTALPFVTANERQRTAAAGAGLRVLWVG